MVMWVYTLGSPFPYRRQISLRREDATTPQLPCASVPRSSTEIREFLLSTARAARSALPLPPPPLPRDDRRGHPPSYSPSQLQHAHADTSRGGHR